MKPKIRKLRADWCSKLPWVLYFPDSGWKAFRRTWAEAVAAVPQAIEAEKFFRQNADPIALRNVYNDTITGLRA